jgi:hypothetical protein
MFRPGFPNGGRSKPSLAPIGINAKFDNGGIAKRGEIVARGRRSQGVGK